MENFFCLILASADSAAKTAHTAASEAAHEAPKFIDQLIHSNVYSVIIAFALIYWLVKRYNLLSGIDDAQKKTIDDLRSAEKSKEDAINQLKEAEKRLSKAKEEADQIIENAEKLAIKIKADIIAEAEKDAERILKQASKSIQNEKELAREDLKRNLTFAAVEVAKDNIKNSLDENWHRKIIQDFVDNLSNVKVK
ncbi:MAG: F0F1 ATP synthase subunit B [Cyanobacteriota bacterium]